MGKLEVRERVWALLEAKGAARFPGARGRIPNFVGAERAAGRLGELEAWRAARVLKANPDAPQRPVRKLALEQGKRVYMAVPRLREACPFWLLDPRRLRGTPAASSGISGASRFGRPVPLAQVAPIDLVVCGSVAVTRDGGRIGKGGGYSDLEFALLMEQGGITEATTILTTVHPLQVVDGGIEMAVHDIPVDAIVTPDEVIRVHPRLLRPAGIYWELLPPEKIEAIPVLRQRRGGRAAERP